MIENVFKLTDELTQLLKQEQHFLNKRLLTQASQLHKEKDRLNGEYQLAVSQLKKDTTYIQSLNEGVVQELTRKTAAMQKLLESNRQQISLFAAANNRILCALVEAFSKKPPIVPSYTALGALVTKAKQRVEALTFNSCI